MTGAAVSLWGRLVGLTVVAWGSVLLVDPPRPTPAIPPALALVYGALAGTALYAGLARAAPVLPSLAGLPMPVVVGKQAFLALCALNEELVWRRLVLGEALRAGVIAAVVVSTIGFALVHRTRQATHLVTGAAFGAAYVVSGSLAAPLAAHWTYNALIAAALDRARSATAKRA